MSLEFNLYRDSTGFEALQADWNALLGRSAFDSLFLTWEWQTTWWRCLGQGELWLAAWRDQGRLVGIAPLYLQADDQGTRYLRLVGCVEVSDYLDLIVAAGHEAAVYRSLLQWLSGPDAPSWDVLDLCNLPEVSLAHQLLPELASAMGLVATSQVEDVCPIIELPGDWESYLQECLSKKQRHEVRRKMRKIEAEAQTRWYVVDGTSDLSWEMDAFIALHRLSAQEKHSFMTPEMEAFFRQITQAMHQAGWLYLAFIEVDGDKAAAMLSFDYHDRMLVYNSGYDPYSHAELSPGIVLTSYVIQDAIQRGCRIFDFLQGNEVYKYRFGATDTVVMRTNISRPSGREASA